MVNYLIKFYLNDKKKLANIDNVEKVIFELNLLKNDLKNQILNQKL